MDVELNTELNPHDKNQLNTAAGITWLSQQITRPPPAQVTPLLPVEQHSQRDHRQQQDADHRILSSGFSEDVDPQSPLQVLPVR